MKSVTNAARQKKLNFKKNELKNEQLDLKRKLAEKFGDKFKAIKRKDDTVVISREALAKSENSVEGQTAKLQSGNLNSEETKAKIKGMLSSGLVELNKKEEDALQEILG